MKHFILKPINPIPPIPLINRTLPNAVADWFMDKGEDENLVL